MKKSGKRGKKSGNRELGTGNGKKMESRPRGLKSSRPGKTIKRSSAAGPKADQKRAAEEREQTGVQHTSHDTSRFLRGQRIDPRRIDGTERVPAPRRRSCDDRLADDGGHQAIFRW